MISRLEQRDAQKAEDLRNLIADIKKDLEVKQNIKLNLTTKLRESSIKYDSLKKN